MTHFNIILKLVKPTQTNSGEVCNDVDECSFANGTGPNRCSSNASCVNTIGSHTCTCNSGFSGDGFQCNDINECNLVNTCHAQATCSNLNGSHSCQCNAGYVGNGADCADQNECQLGIHNCDANAFCTNTDGSFICTCNSGFFASGNNCLDFNECQGGGGGHNCHINAQCNNVAGGFTCNCLPGFTGSGLSCSDINECAQNLDTCHLHATCTNVAGSFNCNCNSGWQGTGFFCSDINECLAVTPPCDPNATCTNTAGSHTCACNTGFLGDGFTCNQNICLLCDSSASCQNNSCQCPAGQMGSGISCDPASAANSQVSKSAIPVKQIPLETNGRTTMCSDQWKKFAAMGRGTNVIIQFYEQSWNECIKMLRDAGVNVYGTVNGKKGIPDDMMKHFNFFVNKFNTEHENLINGIYIRNPGPQGFTYSWYPEVFNMLRENNLLIGIEGYKNKFNLEVAQQVDLIVTYKDNIENFNTNCGDNGVGVFCQNTALTTGQISELQNAVDSGSISAYKFAAIVHRVDSEDMSTVMSQARRSLAGQVYLSDNDVDNTAEPSYFDDFVSLLDASLRKQTRRGAGKSSTCGCTNINECATGLHNCPVNAFCTDTEFSFSCVCNAGFEVRFNF